MLKIKSNVVVPIIIIIVGILIAGTVMYNSRDNTSNPVASDKVQQEDVVQLRPASLDNVRSVTKEDHFLGNLNASIKIIEYSDFECPFCKRFHETMNSIMDEYLEGGQVAWVYRHFPIDQLHPVKARIEAVASECANEIGGKDMFWRFANRFFEVTPSNNRTDIGVVIPQIIQELEIDEQKFNTCMESGKYDKHIQDDIINAVETGGTGTPWSIAVTATGKKFPIKGAIQYSSIKQFIDARIKELE